jgi:ribosome recycling factor
VQLTPEEARELIPKLQRLLQDRIEKAEQEAAYMHDLREKFEENLQRLSLAINPLLSQLEM